MAGRSRRPVTAADRRRQAEQREAKLAALHERLHTEVTALRSGENWTRWLDVARRFHTYSFRNILLIAAQRPDATLVAGYDAWRQLGRQVDRGQKGIQILAPVTGPVDSTAGDTAPASTADDAHAGAAATGAAPRRLVGFRLTHVWDITQTSGEPLPTPPRPTLLRGQAPAGLWDTLAGLATERGFTVDRGDCSPANGLTNFPARTVTVRTDLDDAQAGKSLAHEVAHLLLHDPTDFAGTTRGCRGTREVEAESVAYLVTGAAGLDSSGYTFPYVTHWASDVPGKTVEAVVADTGQRVLATSRSILDRYPPTSATVTAAAELPARVNAGRDRAAVIRTDADHATATATAPAAADGTPRSAAAGAARNGSMSRPVPSTPPRRRRCTRRT